MLINISNQYIANIIILAINWPIPIQKPWIQFQDVNGLHIFSKIWWTANHLFMHIQKDYFFISTKLTVFIMKNEVSYVQYGFILIRNMKHSE